jgi:branched-chain amino acid transport system ATP-binding protein
MSEDNNKIALRLQGIHAGYGELNILENINIEIPAKTSLALLGRNGVGKTTLMSTIMGHATLHSGSIELFGKPIQSLPVYERSRLGIGYVPQTRDIFPSLTVEENMLVAARPGRWPLERVYELFPRLAERKDNMGNQLSGGEQQMLAVGRALICDPSLLLLDEPLEGLAPVIVQMLMDVIKKLIREENLTVILVEQSAKLALQVTDQVLVLNRGQVTHQGKSSDLLSQPEQLAKLISAN